MVFAARLQRNTDQLVCVTGGGFVNNTQVGIAGSKTRLKGRWQYELPKLYVPTEIRADYSNVYISASSSTPETDGSAIVIAKAAAVLYAADGVTVVAGPIPWTYQGARSFTIPAGAAEFMADPLFPADFGVAQFPYGGFVEYRHYIDMTAGLKYPCPDQTFRNPQQSWRGVPSDLVDDIDATGAMTVTGSPDVINTFRPLMMVGRFPGNFVSLAFVGDSIFARQNDFGGLGIGIGSGGFHKRAAQSLGIPHCTFAVGGRTTPHTYSAPKTLSLLKRFTAVQALLGTNDINFSLIGATAGTPTTVSALLTAKKVIWDAARAAGVRTIIETTLPPRLVDNNYKTTDQSQMLPFVTQSTAAQGAPRDGYGFGQGETRDLLNAALLALVPDGAGPDYVFDLASYCQDPTSPWLWGLSAYSSTLAASVAIGDLTVSLTASPPIWTQLVLEPGVANVDIGSQGGPSVISVSGTGPYTAALGYTDAFGTNNGTTPAKVHASGAAVKGSKGTDGTHPSSEVHYAASLGIKPLYRSLHR